jgi:hypothetical protein
MTTSEFLLDHGTKAFALPASAVLHAARTDLALRGKKQDADPCDDELLAQPYAFLAAHVRRSTDAADLLRRAIADDEKWKASAKVNTRLLYGDKTLLADALALAERQ